MLCGGLPFFMVQLIMVLRLFKKIIIFFLALQLAFFTPFANASTSPGGWTFSAFDAVAGVVSAVKNGARATATVAKSPVSQKIAKGVVGGVIAGAAIPLAISQISGIALNSVDWLLDPANNAVKYRKTYSDYGATCWISGGNTSTYSFSKTESMEKFKAIYFLSRLCGGEVPSLKLASVAMFLSRLCGGEVKL